MPALRPQFWIALFVLTGMVAALWANGGLMPAIVGVAGGAAIIIVLWLQEPETPPPAPQLTPAPPPKPAALHQHADFAPLIDVLGTPVLLLGEGRVLAANRPARVLLGDFIVGADVRSAIRHPAAVDRLTRPGGSAADGADEAPTDLLGLGTAGQRWTRQDMALPAGQQLVILSDQSARDAIERIRADFVANASHELRTPLAAILGYVETLQEPDAGGDAAVRARFLSIIDSEARRMQSLVLDLLSISRIESSKHVIPTEAVSLQDVVQRVARELIDSGHHRAAAVEISDTGEPVRIAGDEAQLMQMVHNVISNALRYGRDGTPVKVTIGAAEAGMISLSVSDQSDGIAPEHLPRLTERFYRIDGARSQALGGTGLGLAIVRHIVERHQGQLDIASEIGVGTRVTIRLPARG
jgi:two-component system, OmpR family, phosphate regulon sensor histidine kinase PhoR